MTTKPSDITSIETATKQSWSDWVEHLDANNSRELEHGKIASVVRLELEGNTDSPDWWAQAVTVAYEQHIGRRSPGQRSDGSYETSVTKTALGTKQDLYNKWLSRYGSSTTFKGQAVINTRSSSTPIRSYWRCEMDGGSKVVVAVEQKSSEKAMIAISHTQLPSVEEKNGWQSYWKGLLEQL